MELLIAIILFALSFFLLSIGTIFGKKEIKGHSCGSKIVVDGEELSCGSCPSKQAEVCQSGDKEGFATISQLGNPKRKHQIKSFHFSKK